MRSGQPSTGTATSTSRGALTSCRRKRRSRILQRVQTFDAFTPDNDPYYEHDFGSFEHAGKKVFWKIDCYDRDLKYGSPDPSDESVTERVLTVMLAEEY